MPLAFPAHQGLLAPLWRRWPRGLAVLPLWVGAFVPDPIDGVIRMSRQGVLGQGIGHSLFGALIVDVPVGLLVVWGLRHLWRRLAQRRSGRAQQLGSYLVAVDVRLPGARGLLRDAAALLLGSVSHLLFDLFTHERAQLLFPFATDPPWLPSWWTGAWFRLSMPGYPDYPIGPHFVLWLLLSLVGTWLFVRCRPRR